MAKLSTIHDAIREATHEVRQDEQRLKPATYKVSEDIKIEVEAICEQNGTTLSAYLRWCCNLLFRDYNPKAFSEDDSTPILPAGKKD